MIHAKMRNSPKKREFFQKNSMHKENYMAKSCIAKKNIHANHQKL